MPSYFAHIDHANTTDDPETVAQVSSTEAEHKRIKSLYIMDATNLGKLKMLIERESLIEGDGHLKTGAATLQNAMVIPIDQDIPVGQTFELTLQNVAAGTNAELVGLIEYEILA